MSTEKVSFVDALSLYEESHGVKKADEETTTSEEGVVSDAPEASDSSEESSESTSATDVEQSAEESDESSDSDADEESEEKSEEEAKEGSAETITYSQWLEEVGPEISKIASDVTAVLDSDDNRELFGRCVDAVTLFKLGGLIGADALSARDMVSLANDLYRAVQEAE